jgi:hypothetical protein
MSASPAQIKRELVTVRGKKVQNSVYKHAEILEEIVRLKKQKQGLPGSRSEDACDVDQLCLMQAFQGVILHLSCDISVFSEQYDVPEDALMAIVADWVVSRQMGVALLPIEFFGC